MSAPDIAALEAALAALAAEIQARERDDPYADRQDPMAGAIVADLRAQMAAIERRLGAAAQARLQ